MINFRLDNIYCFYAVDFLPNVLLCRLAGDKIAQMETMSDEDVIEACYYVFKKFWPIKSSQIKITGVKTTKWITNNHFCGTYSYHAKESSSSRELAKPIEDIEQIPRILFAGEATHDYFFSTVHGAIESGYREAERLNKIYNEGIQKLIKYFQIKITDNLKLSNIRISTKIYFSRH